jgi:hypothetical protein
MVRTGASGHAIDRPSGREIVKLEQPFATG